MKTKFKFLLALFLSIFFINTTIYSYIVLADSTNSVQNSIANSNNLAISSEAAILIDANTGKILFDKNANQKMYPASTTKILTAIIVLEHCNLTDQVTASYNAIMSIPAGYSNAAIQENEVLTVQELLEVFLIHSANEAGYILAEYISGTIDNFAILMNQKVAELGCTNTHFTNPSGIHDEDHYSTAYDMALIAKYCMQNDTFRSIVSQTSCTIAATNKYEKRYFTNTNDLIKSSSKYYYEYAIGIKTGFTTQAKNCLISASLKDGLELITVVLGASTLVTGESARYIDTINLFNYGYSNYQSKTIIEQNNVIQNITIPNGTSDTKDLPLLIKDTISAIIPNDLDLNSLKYEINLNEDISAPIAKGSVLGKISYNIDGIEYYSDLIAEHDVEKSNIITLTIQIIMATLVLFILSKFLSKKRNY